MGHPSAVYDLPPAEQARLLGWLFARTEKQKAAGKDATPKPKGLSGDALFDRIRQGR